MFEDPFSSWLDFLSYNNGSQVDPNPCSRLIQDMVGIFAF